MKVLYCALLLSVLISCEKSNDKFLAEVPECVESTILKDQGKKILGSVQVQNIGGENHYSLELGIIPVDGIYAYIINSQCDTICNRCGLCSPIDCYQNYNSEDWETVWERY